MNIELHKIRVSDLVQGYNEGTDKIVGYGGRLDIRPEYQRNFVYPDDKRNEVIYTMLRGEHGFPLNVMYWVKNGKDSYEVLDGQQRTLSICEFCAGNFSIKLYGETYFYDTLPTDKQKQIDDYELMVYFCEGTPEEKHEWFRVVNIAGLLLTDQELRNAVYHGPWLNDAKRYFSKCKKNHEPNCLAWFKGGQYLRADVDRQELLELVLKWISGGDIEGYMRDNYKKPDAHELIEYYEGMLGWIETTFPVYRSDMKGLPWGVIYNAHKGDVLEPEKLELRIQELYQDDDLQNVRGVYQYVLTGDERYLNFRLFDRTTKRLVYERQKGVCPICAAEGREKMQFKFEEMDADHIVPWSKGGKTTIDNCQMLCTEHNRAKGNR